MAYHAGSTRARFLVCMLGSAFIGLNTRPHITAARLISALTSLSLHSHFLYIGYVFTLFASAAQSAGYPYRAAVPMTAALSSARAQQLA